MASSLSEQLVKYLTDVHAMEVQALAQMRAAPKLAGDPELAQAFEAHREETERHEALIRERLDAHDASPSRIEDLLGAVSGKGVRALRALQSRHAGQARDARLLLRAPRARRLRPARSASPNGPATPRRRPSHADPRRGGRDGDPASASSWDRTVAASLEGEDDLDSSSTKYLADAHALEAQAIELLERARRSPATATRRASSTTTCAESRVHSELVEAPPGGSRRQAERAQGRRAAARRAQLGHVLPGPAGHAGQARRVRLRLRAPRDRRLRAAQARGAAGRRHRRPRTSRDRILDEERAAAEKLYGTVRRRRSTPRWTRCSRALSAHEPDEADDGQRHGHEQVQPQPEDVVGRIDADQLREDPERRVARDVEREQPRRSDPPVVRRARPAAPPARGSR